MVAIHHAAYRLIGMTLPIGSVRTDRVWEWIGMTVILDGTIEFRFFWLDQGDWIMPIGPCMAVCDRQFSLGKLFADLEFLITVSCFSIRGVTNVRSFVYVSSFIRK